jgi:cell wall assembly regulator SMI1
MLDREKEVVDANVAWLRLVDLISQNPGEPFGGPESRAYWHYLSIITQLQKPTGEAKERLVALCKEKGQELGLRKSLEKKAGIKPPPPPYAAADLAGLPDAWAKAWKTARERSWEAGYRLPAGANEETLAAAEKALGMPLPGDVRSFYALHDGAGEDECFRGCRLYGIEEAVEKRKWLLGIEGAPFDSTWLPVTDDGAGNHACVVLEGKNAGSVMDFDHETGCGRRLAKSFAAYVQGATWED